MKRHNIFLMLGVGILAFFAAPLITSFADNSFTHAGSGFSFPKEVAGFTRVSVKYYNEAKSDYSVDYDLKQGKDTIHASVFVYPAGYAELGASDAVLRVAFKTTKDEILKVYPGSTLLSDNPVEIAHAAGKKMGQKAVFKYDEDYVSNKRVISEMYLFIHGEHFVKYRVTYPVDLAGKTDKAIQTLLEGLI